LAIWRVKKRILNLPAAIRGYPMKSIPLQVKKETMKQIMIILAQGIMAARLVSKHYITNI